MNVRLLNGFLLSALLLCFCTTLSYAAKVGTAAPDFTLKDLQGNKQSLSSYRGKVVLLNFWSTTCPPCVGELPSLIAIHNQLKASGLVVLGIAIDPTERPVHELATKMKIDYPILLDGSREVYFDSYGLFGQPVSMIVDRGGIVREKIIGPVEWTSPQIKAKMQTYLKGR